MTTDTQSDPSYGYTAHMPGVSFEKARARITDALKQEGFGILTEIDVQATLKAKLDREFRKYVILGACNCWLSRYSVIPPTNLLAFSQSRNRGSLSAV